MVDSEKPALQCAPHSVHTSAMADESKTGGGVGAIGATMGVDIGSSACSVGVWWNGRVRVLPTQLGIRRLASCVGFDGPPDAADTSVYVGTTASRQQGRLFVVCGAPALLGVPREHEDDDLAHCPMEFTARRGQGLEDLRAQWEDMDLTCARVVGAGRRAGCSVTTALGRAAFAVGDEGHGLVPELLTALLFLQLKHDAETALGTAVRHAVVTVPAGCSWSRRVAMCDAAALAGVKVLRCVSPPVAAALAYEAWKLQHGRAVSECVLIVDVGDQSFQAALLDLDDGVVESLGELGHHSVGGADVTKLLFDHCVHQCRHLHRISLVNSQPATRALWRSCENAKRKLMNEAASAAVDVDVNGITFMHTFTREWFKTAAGVWLDTIVTLAKRLLGGSALATGCSPAVRRYYAARRGHVVSDKIANKARKALCKGNFVTVKLGHDEPVLVSRREIMDLSLPAVLGKLKRVLLTGRGGGNAFVRSGLQKALQKPVLRMDKLGVHPAEAATVGVAAQAAVLSSHDTGSVLRRTIVLGAMPTALGVAVANPPPNQVVGDDSGDSWAYPFLPQDAREITPATRHMAGVVGAGETYPLRSERTFQRLGSQTRLCIEVVEGDGVGSPHLQARGRLGAVVLRDLPVLQRAARVVVRFDVDASLDCTVSVVDQTSGRRATLTLTAATAPTRLPRMRARELAAKVRSITNSQERMRTALEARSKVLAAVQRVTQASGGSLAWDVGDNNVAEEMPAFSSGHAMPEAIVNRARAAQRRLATETRLRTAEEYKAVAAELDCAIDTPPDDPGEELDEEALAAIDELPVGAGVADQIPVGVCVATEIPGAVAGAGGAGAGAEGSVVAGAVFAATANDELGPSHPQVFDGKVQVAAACIQVDGKQRRRQSVTEYK